MSKNTDWILYCSVSDINYKSHLRELTDEELRYCLQKETRKASISRLQSEARRRKLTV